VSEILFCTTLLEYHHPIRSRTHVFVDERQSAMAHIGALTTATRTPRPQRQAGKQLLGSFRNHVLLVLAGGSSNVRHANDRNDL
jgi:lipase chaperone LimK